MTEIHINARPAGKGHPCFVIAEAGVNHDGNLADAKALIDAAVVAGADAVKFQSFNAQTLASAAAPKAEYQQVLTDASESQRDMLHRLELDRADHEELSDYCRQGKIMFLSSPFGLAEVDLLRELHMPAFKVPSGELTNPGLLAHIAATGKPVILSTGMATLQEVADAISTLRDNGTTELALLHCVSNYPAAPKDVNLRAMATMADAFGVPVGYSDHTLGIEISLAAVALGACIIEKHFTLDCRRSGPDHAASLEPKQLGDLVQGIRSIESALGHGRKEPAESEAPIAAMARRSLFTVTDIPAGTVIEESMLTAQRPGTGIAPTQTARVVGRRARVAIPAATAIAPDMLS